MPIDPHHLDTCAALRDANHIPHPSTYGIPHDHWREHQYETVQWVANQSGVILTEQPTGSGKSAVSVAQSISQRTVILTRTKNLQEQYGRDYHAHILMGKANYSCMHEDAEPDATCDDCLYADTSMHACEYYPTDCHYGIAKERAMYAPLVCTNYAYWLVGKRLRETDIGLLVLDECQLVPDIVLDWAGFAMNDRERKQYELGLFPVIRSSNDTRLALTWLEANFNLLREQWKFLKDKSKDDKVAAKQAKRMERLGFRFKSTMEALEACTEAWWIRSGATVGNYRGHTMPGIVIRPLTASYHFPRLFLGHNGASLSDNVLLMSATIGNFDAFIRELGIRSYVGRIVPSRFPPSARPVYLLDAPALKRGSSRAAFEKQADVIADAILSCPDDWSGIVHVTRIKEAPLLAERLARHGLTDRVWTPPTEHRGRYLGTLEQIKLWDARRQAVPNSILVAWQFWEGYDGRDEKICIVAKVPFPFLGDPYEVARQKYSHRMYNLRTAWSLMQALGRTRRGRDEDYDTSEEKRGLVAIADGNWTRVRSYLSEDVVNSLAIPDW